MSIGSPLILPGGVAAPEPAQMIGPEDEAQYHKPPTINPLFKVALQATVQGSAPLKQKKLLVHLGLTKEEEQKHADVGVFVAKFKGWTITLNWTTQAHGKLPPHCFHLAFKTQPDVAIVAPYLGDGYTSYWFSKDIIPVDFQRDAVEFIVERTGKPWLWEAFDGPGLDYDISQKGR